MIINKKLYLISTVFFLMGSFAHAAPICKKMERPDSIEPAHSSVAKDDFEKDRTLIEALSILNLKTPEAQFHFMDDLNRLDASDLVIDFGSGQGETVRGLRKTLGSLLLSLRDRSQILFAALGSRHQEETTPQKIYADLLTIAKMRAGSLQPFKTYFAKKLEDRPRVLGITYTMNNRNQEDPGIEFLTGKYFSEYPDEVVPKYSLGFSVYGVFSYTKTLSADLKKALSKLQVGGRLYVAGMNSVVISKSQLKEFEIAKDKVEFVKKFGLSTSQWLKSVSSGLDVAFDRDGLTVIEKKGDVFEIPELLYFAEADSRARPPLLVYFANENSP